MKTTSLLFCLLPIVSFAAVLPERALKNTLSNIVGAKVDPERVAQLVQANVDYLVSQNNMWVQILFAQYSKEIETAAMEAKKELEALKGQGKLDETMKKVIETYAVARSQIAFIANELNGMQSMKEEIVALFDKYKILAKTTYGDMKDKAIEALDNAQPAVLKWLDEMFPEDIMTKNEQQIKAQLDQADLKYEYHLVTANPYEKSVQLLQDGLDNALKTAKETENQIQEQWKKIDPDFLIKINDDIERIITGKSA